MKKRLELFELFKKSNGVSIDTRSIVSGQMFFAINGDNFDGNKYASTALENGASTVVVDNKEFFQKDNDKYVLVENSLISLQKLAIDYRDTLDIPVIGITGSNGKTTTKELINAVLKQKYKVHATGGNFNNHIGVPLTILSAPSNTEILIVEMGASFEGEIAELCKIAKPTEGLITNISSAHMEGFGDFDTIVKTKTALYRYLVNNNGTIYINNDDTQLKELTDDQMNIKWYSPDVDTKFIEATPNVTWSIKINNDSYRVNTQLVGIYNKSNISVATMIGIYHGVIADDIIEAFVNYTPSNNRSQLRTIGTNEYILDAYNANPTSMAKSIENMASLQDDNKVLILGDMLELGRLESMAHQDIVILINKYKWKQVLLVGPRFLKTEGSDKFKCFESTSLLKEYLKKNPITNSLVLLKGSRGIALENILG